jgi:hypothetical protein
MNIDALGYGITRSSAGVTTVEYRVERWQNPRPQGVIPCKNP